MGYKIPIVSKRVTIPFSETNDDGFSFKEYKDKYGIDLENVFIITKSPKEGGGYFVDVNKKDNVEYLINFDGTVSPLFLGADDAGHSSIISLYPKLESGDDGRISSSPYAIVSYDEERGYVLSFGEY